VCVCAPAPRDNPKSGDFCRALSSLRAAAGKECTAECPKRFGKVCANKGTCVADGDNGAKCECFDGFRGETCEIECVGGAARPCAKRGICEPDGTCTCLGGWRGADCSTECPGSNIFPCNIHGKCTREAKCECDPLYRGAACEFRCPDVLGVPCGGRGTCNSVGECDCNIGYRGKDCMQECPVRVGRRADLPVSVWPSALLASRAVCSLSLALPTEVGPTLFVLLFSCLFSLVQGGAANPCSGHGKCLNDTACECSPSWAGEKCDDLCPGGLDNACSGHGKCVTNTENRSIAMCICEQGNGQTSLLRWYANPLQKSQTKATVTDGQTTACSRGIVILWSFCIGPCESGTASTAAKRFTT